MTTSFYCFILLWCLAWLLTVHIWLYGSPYKLVTLSLSNFTVFLTTALSLVLAYYAYQILIATVPRPPHLIRSFSVFDLLSSDDKKTTMNAPKYCARCTKIVYPPEELKCLDKTWHKICFKCSNPECGMALSMNNYSGYDKLPWCKVHVPQAQATAMTATPEMARLAENTRQQSQVAYKGVVAEKAEMEMRREMGAAELAEQNGADGRRLSGPDFTQHLVTPKQVAQMGFNVNRAQQQEQKTTRKVGSLADYEPNKWEEEQGNQPQQLHQSQQPAYIMGSQQPIQPPQQPQQPPQQQQQYQQPQQQQQIQPPQQHAVSLENRGTVFGQRSPVGQPAQTTTWSPSGGQTQNRLPQQPGYLSTPSPVIEPGHDIHERTGPIVVGAGGGKSPDVRYVKPWSPNTGSAPPQSYQQPQQQQQQQYGAGINSPSPVGQQYATPPTPSPTPWSNASSQQQSPQYGAAQQSKPAQQQQMYSPPQTTSPQQSYGAPPPSSGGANLYEQHRQQMTQQNQQRPYVQSSPAGQQQQQQQQPKYGGHPGVGAAYGAAAAGGANRLQQSGGGGQQQQQQSFKALYDYNARDADEVSFRNGDVIVNTQSVGQGWMQGQNTRTGQRGLLPANYVAPC